jgi:hypothetical protein
VTTKEAVEHLSKVMQEDPEYAWGWHCNIAMAAFDEGLDHEHSNKAAGRFMHMCFGVNTINNDHSDYKGE